MTTKVCSKCGEEKEDSEFYKDKSVKSGLKSSCKECDRKRAREMHAKNPSIVRSRALKWRNNNIEKARENYRLYKENNKEKELERSRKYYIENSEKERERRKQYYWKNRELELNKNKEYRKSEQGKLSNTRRRHTRRTRLKKTPCTLTLLQWEKILKSQGNKCAICGKRFCKSRPPTKDHIIPLSKGGGLTFENVQALCQSCNVIKRANLDHSKIITWCMS